MQSSDQPSPLRITDLTVAYDRKPVVWDVDVSVIPQSITAIIGPNGAGKSTLLKASLGLVRNVSGDILFFGKPYAKARRRVAYVPQRESVDWDYPVTALDVVVMGLYHRVGWCLPVLKSHRKKALEALERVSMETFANRQISELSGGQQQRVFLARALVQDADFYMMDEPFAGVDATTEKAIVQIMQDLRAQGKTILCVHHDLTTASEYFDHVILMNLRKVMDGPMSEVFTMDNLRKTYGGKLTLLDQITQALARFESGKPEKKHG